MKKSIIKNCIIINNPNFKEALIEENKKADGSVFVNFQNMAIVSLEMFNDDTIKQIYEWKKTVGDTDPNDQTNLCIKLYSSKLISNEQ